MHDYDTQSLSTFVFAKYIIVVRYNDCFSSTRLSWNSIIATSYFIQMDSDVHEVYFYQYKKLISPNYEVLYQTYEYLSDFHSNWLINCS